MKTAEIQLLWCLVLGITACACGSDKPSSTVQFLVVDAERFFSEEYSLAKHELLLEDFGESEPLEGAKELTAIVRADDHSHDFIDALQADSVFDKIKIAEYERGSDGSLGALVLEREYFSVRPELIEFHFAENDHRAKYVFSYARAETRDNGRSKARSLTPKAFRPGPSPLDAFFWATNTPGGAIGAQVDFRPLPTDLYGIAPSEIEAYVFQLALDDDNNIVSDYRVTLGLDGSLARYFGYAGSGSAIPECALLQFFESSLEKSNLSYSIIGENCQLESVTQTSGAAGSTFELTLSPAIVTITSWPITAQNTQGRPATSTIDFSNQ